MSIIIWCLEPIQEICYKYYCFHTSGLSHLSFLLDLCFYNAHYQINSCRLYIRADSNLADLFVAIWNQIFKIKVGTKKYALFMLLKYKNPVCECPLYTWLINLDTDIFSSSSLICFAVVVKKLMSSVYEEYKDEDGTLNISLSGEIRDILPQPSPNNISASTFFVNNIPS